MTLIDAKQAPEWVRANNPQEIALYLGFDLYSYGDCISWDILEAVAGPGDIMLVVTWKDFGIGKRPCGELVRSFPRTRACGSSASFAIRRCRFAVRPSGTSGPSRSRDGPGVTGDRESTNDR